jgi:hypothetical protein
MKCLLDEFKPYQRPSGSGNFDWLGNLTLTNGINVAEPQRFYRISLP